MSDVQKLITEARARALTAQGVKTDTDELGLNTQLLIRLADALDAATSPVEPEPGDREELVSALIDALGVFPDGETLDPNRSYLTQEAECAADAVLAAGFSRPVGGETETEWGVSGDNLIGVETKPSREAAEDRATWLAAYWRGRYRFGVVQRCKAGPWLPVSPEQDGGK